MTHEKTRAALIFVTIIAVVGSICWAISNADQTQANTEDPKAMPKLDIQQYVRDMAIEYIKTNHADASQFLNNISWTGGRQETNLLGSEKYIWQSQGWTLTIQYPVVAQPTYKITADYSAQQISGSIGIPYRIAWEGTWQNDSLCEKNYSFAQ